MKREYGRKSLRGVPRILFKIAVFAQDVVERGKYPQADTVPDLEVCVTSLKASTELSLPS